MENDLYNKFSIGLSLTISIDEYKKIIEDYRSYLNSIYFSLPLGDIYHSRSAIEEKFKDTESINLFYNIIKLFKDNNILLDCVFNKNGISDDDVITGLKFLKEYIEVGQITCLSEHIEIINDFFPNVEKIYSYNNDLNKNKIDNISDLFDTVVVGKSFLRNYDLLKKIYNNDFDIKLLVNNGCSYNCLGCRNGSKVCEEIFNKNKKYHDINYMYAEQSFYPFELLELLDVVDFPIKYIKISNRTSGFEYLYKCLESYIYNVSPNEYIKDGSKYYRLWCRLAHFNRKMDELNYDEIIKQKKILLDRSREKCI